MIRKKHLPILLSFFFLCLNACALTYKYRSEIDKWRPEIQKFAELDKQESYPDNSILFLGSSSIRLWDSIEEDMAPYPVIQRGYGGASFADVAFYAEQVVEPHELAAIVLFAGNDIWGKPTDRSPEDIEKLLRYTLKKIRRHHPTIPLFIIEVTHVPAREHLIEEINVQNETLQRICSMQKKVYWIATKNMFLTSENKIRREIFRDDDIHQNESGYRQWTQIIKSNIKKHLKT